jgi:glycosyltransferase involved in cell wall biosynthesis
MKRLRLAIDCRIFSGSGIATFTRGIVANLDISHDYLLIGDPRNLATAAGPGREIIPCYIPPHSMREMVYDVARLGADALFCPTYSLFGYAYPRRFISVHDVLFLDRPEFCRSLADRIAKRLYLLASCRASKAVFTVSAFTRDRLKETTGTLKPIHVAPNGLLDMHSMVKAATTLKQDYVVFVGNLKRHKNLSVAISAMKVLHDRGDATQLRIIGRSDARDVDAGASACDRPRTLPNVHFLGSIPREDVIRAVANARFLVQPSLYEGFSLSPLEALACGTQPIVSDIAAHRETLRDTPAIFFDPMDAGELARLITQKPLEVRAPDMAAIAIAKGFDYRKSSNIITDVIAKAM